MPDKKVVPFKVYKNKELRYNAVGRVCIEIASNGVRMQTFETQNEFLLSDQAYILKAKTRNLTLAVEILYHLGLETKFTPKLRKTPLKKRNTRKNSYLEIELVDNGFILYTYNKKDDSRNQGIIFMQGALKDEKELALGVLETLNLSNIISLQRNYM